MTDRFLYAPYGELVYRSGNTITPFLFNGQYGVMTDAGDLYYMRARYYNPVAKRFLSPDTLTGQITNPQSQNLYTYCEGNPVIYVDPTGHAKLCTMEDYLRELLRSDPSKYEYYYEKYKALQKLIQNELNILYGDYSQSEKDVAKGYVDRYMQEYEVINELLIINGNYSLEEKENAKATLLNLLEEDKDKIQEALLICSGGGGQFHHIASDKAIVSGFTEQFRKIFSKAGMSLQNERNIIFIEKGHIGRHSIKYRLYVLNRLESATQGLSGDTYKEALLKELEILKNELITNPDIIRGVGLP